jgi:hypothetical protein
MSAWVRAIKRVHLTPLLRDVTKDLQIPDSAVTTPARKREISQAYSVTRNHTDYLYELIV